MRPAITHIVLFILLFTSFGVVAQQDASEEEVKGAYILSFLDKVKWEGGIPDKFSVGIVQHPKLLEVIRKESKEVHLASPIEINPIVGNEIEGYNVIYFSQTSTNEQIQAALQSHNQVLVITDEFQDVEKGMINFYHEDGVVKFSLNLSLLNKKRLEPTIELLIYAGYKKQALDAYYKAEAELLSEKKKYIAQMKLLKEKEDNINKLTDEIQKGESKNSELLESIREKQNKIEAQEYFLRELVASMDLKKQELQTAKDSLMLIRKSNHRTQLELASFYGLLEQKKEEVEVNNRILKEQEAKLAIQNQQLSEKEEKLKYTSDIMIIVMIFTIFVLALLFVIYKENNAKKRTLKIIERQNKRITEASSHKDQFIANLSHEVRTPLNAIVGYTKLLMNKSNRETRQILEHIVLSSNNLLAIINDILDLSKIESGKIELENTPFDLHAVIKNAFESLQINAKSKQIGYTFKLDKDLPSRFIGDPTKISQVVLNLLSNAIKFTEKGSVQIEVTLKEKKEGKARVSFVVYDTGKGISKGHQETIFESFVQEDASITREFGGTGLGLTISQKLVQAMGGEIVLESTLGKGSTFRFDLLIDLDDDENRADQVDGLINVQGIDKLNIIYADDNEVNLRLMEMYFTEANQNCHLDFAHDGQELYEAVKTLKYDVVLTDIRMPYMSGVQVAAKLKEEGVEVPIIGISANALKRERNEAIKAGMSHFFTKPFKFNEILLAIAQSCQLSYEIESNEIILDSPEQPTVELFKDVKRIFPNEEEYLRERETIITSVNNLLEELKPDATDHDKSHRLLNLMLYVGDEDLRLSALELDKATSKDLKSNCNELLLSVEKRWEELKEYL